MYNLELGHTTVIGRTQEGKTYTINKILKNENNGVIFFNTQLEDLKGYIKADKMTPFNQILNLLKKSQKINYFPDSRLEIQSQEIKFLIEKLFEYGKFDRNNFVYFVVDEVHLFKEKALSAVERISTGGMRFGIRGVFLSQRPANISNTLMTQSNNMIIFFCNMESQYFKSYSIPIEDILSLIKFNGKYSFCTYDFKKIKDYKAI